MAIHNLNGLFVIILYCQEKKKIWHNLKSHRIFLLGSQFRLRFFLISTFFFYYYPIFQKPTPLGGGVRGVQDSHCWDVPANRKNHHIRMEVQTLGVSPGPYCRHPGQVIACTLYVSGDCLYLVCVRWSLVPPAVVPLKGAKSLPPNHFETEFAACRSVRRIAMTWNLLSPDFAFLYPPPHEGTVFSHVKAPG